MLVSSDWTHCFLLPHFLSCHNTVSYTHLDVYKRQDSEGNDYDVEVPYNYYICTVTLSNENLSHLPVYIMGEEQLSRYALYKMCIRDSWSPAGVVAPIVPHSCDHVGAEHRDFRHRLRAHD